MRSLDPMTAAVSHPPLSVLDLALVTEDGTAMKKILDLIVLLTLKREKRL